jgi:hypothetical protein
MSTRANPGLPTATTDGDSEADQARTSSITWDHNVKHHPGLDMSRSALLPNPPLRDQGAASGGAGRH